MLNDMEKDIKDLVQISQEIGQFQDFVQGGGGNTSVKLDDNLMVIKASGFFLKQMTEDDGFAIVKYDKIREYIQTNNSLEVSEEELSKSINNSMQEIEGFPKLRPSIETGFHAILPEKFVVHTHSVYANILCCSKEGRDIAKTLFPKSLWVPYANPGKEITFKINLLAKGEKIIFMQNHGIIVSGETMKEVIENHRFVNEKIIEFFEIEKEYNIKNLKVDMNFLKQNVIFPDQVVYLLSQELQHTIAGVETLNAFQFIISNVKKIGLTLNLISQKDVNYIENMESEKYRKSLIKQ